MRIAYKSHSAAAAPLRASRANMSGHIPEPAMPETPVIARRSLLALALGDAEAYWVNHWIYETEFGRYPDDALPARTDEEFWDFLCSRLQ